MRYVDEYRAPEQVLQLIDRLKTRASLLDYTKENCCGSWRCADTIRRRLLRPWPRPAAAGEHRVYPRPEGLACAADVSASTAVSTSPAALV